MSQVKLGDRVKEGGVLGRVVDPVSNTGSDVVAPFTGRVIGMAVNQVVQTGFAAYHLGVVKAAEEVQEEAMDAGPETPDSTPEEGGKDVVPEDRDESAEDEGLAAGSDVGAGECSAAC